MEVVAFGKSASLKLKEAADHFVDLSSDPHKYLITPRGGGNGTRAAASTGPANNTPVRRTQTGTRKVVRKIEE